MPPDGNGSSPSRIRRASPSSKSTKPTPAAERVLDQRSSQRGTRRGAGWVGCGNGFAVHAPALRSLDFELVIHDLHPSAVAVARLAAPRLAAGEGVDPALAAPIYVRDKVALTERERAGP